MDKKVSELWGDRHWQGKVAKAVEVLLPDATPDMVRAVIEAIDALRDDIVEVIYRECSDRNTDEE